MSRTQWITLVVLVPVVIISALLIGGMLADDGAGGAVSISDASEETAFDYDFVIPPGTADRIAAGEEVEIVPAELDVHVGDSIRIVNDDSEGHVVGLFYVGAGETLTQRFNSEGVLEGECSVHPSGEFTLVVEA